MKVVVRACAAVIAVLLGAASVQAQSLNSLSGTVRGRGGQPIPGATVVVTIGAFSEDFVTNGAGQYAINTPSGPAYVQVFGNGPAGIAPDSFYAERTDAVVLGQTTLDFDLNVAQVSGIVSNPDSTPASGATLFLQSFDFPSSGRTFSSVTTTSAANGAYSVLLLQGTASTLVVAPPPVNPDDPVPPALSDTFPIAGDLTHDFAFSALVNVHGTVFGRGGGPVSGASVTVSVGATIDFAMTDDQGAYSVNVGKGTAFVQISGGGPTGVAPPSFYVERNDLVVNGSMQADFTLPAVQITGTVSAPVVGNVPSAIVDVQTNSVQGLGRFISEATVTTDANGNYDAIVLTGSADATVTPPAGTNLTTLTRSFAVTADVRQDFTLSPATTVNGTVVGRGGAPVVNATVNVSVNSTQATVFTDVNGQYSVSVPTGVATVAVFGGGDGVTPASFSVSRFNVAVNGVTTVNFALPVDLVTGVVVDANGVPIPGITVEGTTGVATSTGNSSSLSQSVSGADGTFSYLLLGGGGQVVLAPASGSGFASSAESFALAGDLAQRLVIQHDDVTPPIFTLGPFVLHQSATSATIGWSTNRPSTSNVDFGIGSPNQSASDGTLTLDHVVTLTGLSAGSTYVFVAGSTDGAGNGPAVAPQGSFKTLASPGDATVPVLLSGPTLAFVDPTSAIIEWTTDEPSSSVVEYGSPAVPVDGNPGHFTQVHRVRLTGLVADTDYTGRVLSADPDGNGITGAPFLFHTAAAADTFAPAIVAGPVAIVTTDSRIVVAWTTDEAATSGVSFNDGTAFDLTSDATLTRNHQMTLAGLTPATTYHITVSSTDADGNGPTLSATFDVTTATAPDTTAPGLAAVGSSNVTASSAVISWTSDELASQSVKFGKTAGSPDLTVADLTTGGIHTLLLTGLEPGTTYYFVVDSVDTAGNLAESAPASFATTPVILDQPPSPPSPVNGPSSPTRAATIHITWGAAVDDFGVTGYEVLRDGSPIATVDGTTLFYDDTSASEGSHAYRIGALDIAGHETLSATLTIVVDRTPPILSLPGDQVVNAVGATATVTFSATATDNLDVTVPVVCAPASGSAFPVGQTTVSCSATDTAGNTANGTFKVTVRDVTPPTVTVPADITREATSPSGAVVTFGATATDAVDGNITPVCVPASGSTFALGTTTVTCTATDHAGNQGHASFHVTVVDTTAPVISRFSPSQSSLWPPNHKMVSLSMNVTVTDVADPAPVCRITAITSNESVTGAWTFSGLNFSLRAERNGDGSGRIYTIYGECRDASGNVATATATVTVPHNQ